MRLIRTVLGAVILFFDRLFKPKALITRSPERQRDVDAETARLSLYQFASCPFCVKVRRHITRRGLTIELRDVLTNTSWEKELVTEGGQRQVPCLRIQNDDGSVRWLYESSEIVSYLDSRFSS